MSEAKRDRWLQTAIPGLRDQIDGARGDVPLVRWVEAAIVERLARLRLEPDTARREVAEVQAKPAARPARSEVGLKDPGATPVAKLYGCPVPGCSTASVSDRVTCPHHGYRVR